MNGRTAFLLSGCSLEGDISVALQTTGMLSGDYGSVEAYQRKIEEITPWLKESDERIREFAENYISELSKQAEREKQRADENIMLRKHRYEANEES
ncbi:MAG: hypothetical protein ABW189_03795 [Rickettsiales bacterium]